MLRSLAGRASKITGSSSSFWNEVPHAHKLPHRRIRGRGWRLQDDKCCHPVLRNRGRSLTTETSSTPAEDYTAARLRQILDPSTSSSSSKAALKTWIDTLSSSQRRSLTEQLSETTAAAAPSTVEAVSAVGDTAAAVGTSGVAEPSLAQLRLVALNTAIPFIGFGFMDNAILIIAGDAIDTSLGVMLGISVLCSAAIGNIISDVAGIMLGTVIEDMAAQLNLPTSNLTAAQRQLRSVRLSNQLGCAVGIVIGCIIGMFPLLFIDSTKVQVKKQKAHLDSIFRDVVTEAGSLVGAARMRLFVRVDNDNSGGEGGGSKDGRSPKADGKFLYAKYQLDADSHQAQSSDRLIPLGRGIVSRATLTGEAWNIQNVQKEPDYHGDAAAGPEQDDTRSMVCVPVLDAQGRTIAVLEAVNKIGRGRADAQDNGNENGDAPHEQRPWVRRRQSVTPRSFTKHDVQILKALASHIGVSLQRMYENDGEEEEQRLRDTIRMLKEYGLAGLGDEGSVASAETRRRPLFPED